MMLQAYSPGTANRAVGEHRPGRFGWDITDAGMIVGHKSRGSFSWTTFLSPYICLAEGNVIPILGFHMHPEVGLLVLVTQTGWETMVRLAQPVEDRVLPMELVSAPLNWVAVGVVDS